jgi:hypothetical protein
MLVKRKRLVDVYTKRFPSTQRFQKFEDMNILQFML